MTMQNDDLKYAQVCHDYKTTDGVEIKKREILMLIEKKNDWWICTRDDGNNNFNKPFFVPVTYLIEIHNNSNQINNNNNINDYEEESEDYINVISDLDEILERESSRNLNFNNNNNNNISKSDDDIEVDRIRYGDDFIEKINNNNVDQDKNINNNNNNNKEEEVEEEEEEEEEDSSFNYINNQLAEQLYIDDRLDRQLEPPKIKERKIPNKNYVKEHEEKERQRLQEYLNNSLNKVETPEPDYDIHEYVNVESLGLGINNNQRPQEQQQQQQQPIIDPPDYSDNDDTRADNLYQEEINDKNNTEDIEDPYDISQEYNDNKLISEEPYIPNGWISNIDRYKRKYYYHELDPQKNKWFLAYDEKEGKPYFYDTNYKTEWRLPDDLNIKSINNSMNNNNNNNNTSNNNNNNNKQFNETKMDPNLPTFNKLRTVTKNINDHTNIQQQFDSLQEQARLGSNPSAIKYSYKPTEMLQSKFKILRLKENGKDIKKKTVETHLIHLASSKLLFVKESAKRLEYHLDFKGGKCYKFDSKKLHKLADGVKKKTAFLVETLDGNQVLFIHDDEELIDKWIGAINSVIKQIQSEFSPIYERPDTLHPINMIKDKYFNPTPLNQNNNSNNNNNNKKETVVLVNDENNNNNSSMIYDYQQIVDKPKLDIDDNDDGIESEESNNYDNKNLFENNKNNVNNTTHNDNNNNKLIKKKGSEYYVVEFSTNNNNNDDNNNNHKIIEPTIKCTGRLFGRKKSSEAEIKIEKKLIASNSNIQQNQFKNIKQITETLIAFFKKRPSADQLKQRGILQECIFGSNLVSLCTKEGRAVPEFVEDLIKAIERKGLDADGLYRICGNLSDVQKLRCQLNQGKKNFNDFDIHVLTGTLKTFFRELEDPLIPLHMQDRFLKAISFKDNHKKFKLIKELINEMPIPHRETSRTLFKHLLNVIKLSTLNRMHKQNMALVFGPTLLRLNPLNPATNCLNENIILQNDLIEFILCYYEELFELMHNNNNNNNNNLIHNSTSSITAGGSIATDISASITMATSVTTVTTNFK